MADAILSKSICPDGEHHFGAVYDLFYQVVPGTVVWQDNKVAVYDIGQRHHLLDKIAHRSKTARELSLIDRIALCIAGMEAQLLFGCESTHLHAGSSDFGKIIEMLDDLTEGDADTIRSKGYDRAAELLVCRRPLIERIAEQLAISGKLEQGEVLALLQEAEQQSR